jgi:hypothetical protein
MGMLDRMLRVCIGIIVIVTGILSATETLGVILIILSIPLLVTGITGFCPGYVPFGISTKREGNCC